MSQFEQIQKKIMKMVAIAEGQRLRLHALVRMLSHELRISTFRVREVLEDLVRDRKLVLTYRDPFTFVELPMNEWPPGVRPMKVVVNGEGNPWICDHHVDPSRDLAGQGCWQLKEEDSSQSDEL